MNIEIAIFLIVFLSIIIGYFIGSIMFADTFGYFLKKSPRHYGSFNPGTTNSIRVFGKKYGIIVGFLDILKGLIPFVILFLLFKYWLGDYVVSVYNETFYLTYLSSFFAVIGHAWPVFFKFKGGKAVAPTCGLLIAVSIWWFLIIAIVWWTITLVTKYVSLASLISFVVLAIIDLISYLDYLYWFDALDKGITFLNYNDNWYIILYFEIMILILNVIVFYKHKANIIRLLNKQENKITNKLKNGK